MGDADYLVVYQVLSVKEELTSNFGHGGWSFSWLYRLFLCFDILPFERIVVMNVFLSSMALDCVICWFDEIF